MDSKIHNRKVKKSAVWIGTILVLLIAVSTFWLINNGCDTPQSLYKAAVSDAITADKDEIELLVTLTKDNPLTTWDEQGRVLLLSWHRRPELYIQGKKINMEGSVWTFTDKEIANWYEENKSGITDWNLRLEQLIGLPPEAGYTHISGFWANIDEIIRPAYVTDTTKQMKNVFEDDIDPNFRAWFEENSRYSYYESAYPWTRLGYTYDWADNGKKYGLTEFLIEENAVVEIAFIKTTNEFIDWLEQGAEIDTFTKTTSDTSYQIQKVN